MRKPGIRVDAAPPPSGACDSGTAPPERPAEPEDRAATLKAAEAGARHCLSLHAWYSIEPERAGTAAPVTETGTSIRKEPSYTDRGFSANSNFLDLPSG